MKALELVAHVDDQHRLRLELPADIPQGPVRVLVLLPDVPQEGEEAEGEVEAIWMQAIAREWHAELSDPREDIYTLEDGEPLDAAR